MKLSNSKYKKSYDNGDDLKIGDTVYIKCIVENRINDVGDMTIRLRPRLLHDEYARTKTNAIFLRRSFLNPIYRLINKIIKIK